jgi:hypothetical protein
MSKITLALQLLSDGEWHQIEALRQSLEFDEFEVEELADFLEKYGFATIDNKKCRIKVNPDFQKLLIQNTCESTF